MRRCFNLHRQEGTPLRSLLDRPEDLRPIFLINGASRGLGKTIADYFDQRYRVIRVSRTSGDICGDLCDSSFRRKLVNDISPAIVVNNAGIYPKRESAAQTFEINAVASIELTVSFARKMKSGHIFNISSVSAGLGLLPYASEEEISYSVSKKALSDYGEMLQYANRSAVKITTLEPGFIMTDLADIKSRFERQSSSDFIVRRGVRPMDPNYIAKVIDWVIHQPPDIVISNLRIMNQTVP